MRSVNEYNLCFKSGCEAHVIQDDATLNYENMITAYITDIMSQWYDNLSTLNKIKNLHAKSADQFKYSFKSYNHIYKNKVTENVFDKFVEYYIMEKPYKRANGKLLGFAILETWEWWVVNYAKRNNWSKRTYTDEDKKGFVERVRSKIYDNIAEPIKDKPEFAENKFAGFFVDPNNKN